MKKIISVLLSVIMIFSLVSVGAVAADDELIITVANDLHYNMAGSNTTTSYTEDYAHVPSTGQLRVESELIVDTFLKATAENESQIVLLPGDIVDTGVRAEHEYMVEKLAAFEASSGKPVYVVPGNHEFYGGANTVTVDEYEALYADFGYSEAIANDPLSASYVVDLNDEYRLLAIDSTKPGDGAHGMTAERVEWIREQAKKAYEDGKKTIAMMHHNLLEHFIFGNTLHVASVIEESWGIEEIFTQYNVKYNFVGHTHEHDIASYTGSNGNTFYDIVTSALNAYPCPYRVVTFGDKVKIETRTVDSIDMSSLKGIISENCYNLACADFTEYARECAWAGVSKTVEGYLTPARLKSLLSLNAEEDAEMCALIDDLTPAIKQAVYLPMYKADETQEGMSIESLAAKLNLTLPKSEFENTVDLAVFFYEEHVVGDENYGILSDEFTILTVAMSTILNYILKDVTAEQYAKALNFLCGYLKLTVPANFLGYAGDGLSRAKGIDIFVSAIVNAVLLQFTTDENPNDNNVTLPGYEEPVINEEELSLWDKIVKFFTTIFDYILRFFGVGK